MFGTYKITGVDVGSSLGVKLSHSHVITEVTCIHFLSLRNSERNLSFKLPNLPHLALVNFFESFSVLSEIQA